MHEAGTAEQLLPLVYDELRRLAAQKLNRENPGQTLQATALVHEAWLRLGGDEQPDWQNRAHFFAGLTLEEAARTLNFSAPTAKRHWAYARAWMYRAIQRNQAG